MTTRKGKAKLSAMEGLVAGDHDLMKSLMKEALQEVLESEMTEHLGATPGERTEGRTGYRAGYYSRGWVPRSTAEIQRPSPRAWAVSFLLPTADGCRYCRPRETT